jgi:hypothetical protein
MPRGKPPHSSEASHFQEGSNAGASFSINTYNSALEFKDQMCYNRGKVSPSRPCARRQACRANRAIDSELCGVVPDAQSGGGGWPSPPW